MKKITALLLAILTVLTLSACKDKKTSNKNDETENEPKSSQSQSTENPSSLTKTDDELAKETLERLMAAKTYEDLTPIVTKNSQEYFNGVRGISSLDDYKVTVKKIGDYKDYVFYNYELIAQNDPENTKKGVELFKKENGNLIIENDPTIQGEIVQNCVCPTCSGSGNITSQNTCGICGGLGTQYYPNAYYDAAMQMWMGETRACSGCGGAGHHGSNTSSCNNCGGVGFKF